MLQPDRYVQLKVLHRDEPLRFGDGEKIVNGTGPAAGIFEIH